jgi:hypothetical protein
LETLFFFFENILNQKSEADGDVFAFESESCGENSIKKITQTDSNNSNI